MKIVYKIVALEVLFGGYVFLFLKEIMEEPFLWGRLVVFFLLGAVMALFMQGPQYGNIHPVSDRPVCIALGTLIMGASLLWGLVIKGH